MLIVLIWAVDHQSTLGAFFPFQKHNPVHLASWIENNWKEARRERVSQSVSHSLAVPSIFPNGV
jgi:hypothetical protein